MSTAVSHTPDASARQPSMWWLFLLQGIMAIILGLMFLTAPGATLVALAAFLGFYWLITGILALVRMFVHRSVPWIWSLIVGIMVSRPDSSCFITRCSPRSRYRPLSSSSLAFKV